MIHEILLKKYGAAWADGAGTASLGTADSYGLEQLHVTPGEGWEGLTITATFHPPSGDSVRVPVPADGLLDVPWEATASTGRSCRGKIVFAGVTDGVRRISCDLIYTVMLHAPVEGAQSSESPDVLEQTATYAQVAVQAAEDARASAAAAQKSAEDAEKSAEDAEKTVTESIATDEQAQQIVDEAFGSEESPGETREDTPGETDDPGEEAND